MILQQSLNTVNASPIKQKGKTMTYEEKFELLYEEIMKDFENVTDEKPKEMLKAVQWVVQKAYELGDIPET